MERGWRSAESTRLPPMWPGYDCRTRRLMWVEFVVGSRPCSYSIWNPRAAGLSVEDCLVSPSLNKVNLFIYLIYLFRCSHNSMRINKSGKTWERCVVILTFVACILCLNGSTDRDFALVHRGGEHQCGQSEVKYFVQGYNGTRGRERSNQGTTGLQFLNITILSTLRWKINNRSI